ncbi:LD-carboxypeptidase [bacterium]|nr:LD-carboxypeptidase [bacterium]
MNLIKPKKLQEGDTIKIIAPSGYIEYEKILNAKKYFELQGYRVKVGKNIQKKLRYMSGSDEERLADLHEAFLDKDVNAVLCARGGYGAIRLLNKINYGLIEANPKIFCGYSDITALSAMIFKRTGLITFSGPMVKSDFQTESIDNFTVSNFWNTLKSNIIQITPMRKNPSEFKFSGILIGGNLATFASLSGLDFIPNESFMFFAEDLNEPIYKIDRYFTQLFNIKEFKENVKVIILGEFLDIEDTEQLTELFNEIEKEHNIPVIGYYPISHGKKKVTVPYGGTATLKNGLLTVEY